MYKKAKIFLIALGVVLGVFLGSGVTFALDINQQILDLRKQIEDLTKQSEQYKKNITQKQKETDTLNRQISILTNQILQLETQIAITDRQISSTRLEIGDLQDRIFNTQESIDKKKAAISELITAMYQRDQMSLTAILANIIRLSDITDIAQQERNLNLKIKDLVVSLTQQRDELNTEKTDMETKKQNLEVLNNQRSAQKDSVEGSKVSKDKLLVTTKGKQQEYQKLLNDVEAKKTAFFSELSRLESEAVKSGAYIVHVTASSMPSKNSLDWPEDSYVITQGYGMTAYARRGAYGGAPHNGVDISTGYGTAIHPISDGNVLASGQNDGWGNWVAVRHAGDYVSIYAHMRAPSGLANGTNVTHNSVIGYEGSTGNSTGSHLHISIYQDFFTYINPKNNQLYFNYFEGTVNPLTYLK